MKTIFSLLLGSILAGALSPSTGMAQQGHRISIQVEQTQAEQAMLAYYYWDKQYILDTVARQGANTFVFEGDTLLAQGIYLVVFPPENAYFEIIVGADQQFSLKTDVADFVANMKVEGSTDNAVFYEDIRFIGEQRKKAQAYQQQLSSLPADDSQAKATQEALSSIDQRVKQHREQLVKNFPEGLYTSVLRALREPEIPEAPAGADSMFAFYWYRGHFFDEVDLQDYRLIRTPILYNKINQYLEKLTYLHPDSINKSIDLIVERSRGNDEMFKTLVGNLLNKYANSKVMGMDAVYVHMVEKYYLSGEAYWADREQVKKMEERALAISPTIIGKKAPNLVMQDLEGRSQDLQKIDADYTILYFWDYDCGHCKKETPKLAELYKAYQSKGVALYAVSINGEVATWKEQVAKYGLGGVNVQDHARKTGFGQKYDIRSTPRVFLLDADKKILAKHISVEQLGELLDKLMEEEKAGK